MRVAAFVLMLLLSTVGARAAFLPPPIVSPAFWTPPRLYPPKFVASGGHVILWQVTALNLDCSSNGPVTFRMLQPPAHGTIKITTTKVFPNYPVGNLRDVCNWQKVTGQRVTYTSQKGFSGRDFVEFETIYPAGAAFITRIPVFVR